MGYSVDAQSDGESLINGEQVQFSGGWISELLPLGPSLLCKGSNVGSGSTC